MTLSERNTVELVIKLKELGFLGKELLHTTNGKEYVTEDKLVSELDGILKAHGGRLALVELPSLLGMDLVHCQAAAERLSRSNDVSLAHGELFSSVYFEELANEIDEKLQSSGILALGDVARAQGLSMEMLSGEISKNVGTRIHGTIDPGAQMIYTNAYINRVRCQVRGALRGSMQPVHVASLKKDVCGIDGPAGFFPGLVDDVISTEKLNGKILSNTWVPTAHLESQMKLVDSFYAQNYYVSREFASKHGIDKEVEYFTTMDPNGLLLDQVYISTQIVHTMVASVEEAVQSDGFCDVRDHVPASDFTDDDVSKLVTILLRSGSNKESKMPILSQVEEVVMSCDTCIVSKKLLDEIRHAVQQFAAAAAKEEYASSRQTAGKSASDSSKMVEDGDDGWDTGKGGGKGKKKGKGGKASKKANKGAAASDSGSQKAQNDSRVKSQAYILAQIIDKYPELEAYEDMASAIASAMAPIASAAYDAATHEIFTAGASKRKEIKEQASQLLQSSFYWLELFFKGSSILFEEQEPQKSTADWHVIKSNGIKCLDALLHYLDADIARPTDTTDGDGNENINALQKVETPLTPVERVSIIKECPQQLAQQLEWIHTATKSNMTGGASEFLEKLLDTAENAGIRLKSLDKKTDASLTEQHRNILHEQLENADSSPTLLAAAVPLLILKHMNACVNLPGKSLAPSIQSLNVHLEENDVKALESFHKSVIDQLKSGGEDCATDEAAPSLYDKVKALALQ